MRAYIIRRILLMAPTLFGVTLVTFIVMQFAPGDPLKMQIGQGGSQGESSATREAFLHQRRQWKLDKPAILNFRWFHDYSDEARRCAWLFGQDDSSLAALLEDLATSGAAAGPPGTLGFLQGLGIDSFDDQLKDSERRKGLPRLIRTALQIRVEEEIAEHGVWAFASLLDDPDLKIRIGAIRCLTMCTLGDPFIYTYSRDPNPDETAGVVTTWTIWWNRVRSTFKPIPPERLKELRDRFRAMVAEPSRGKILEDIDLLEPTDAPFFMEILLGDSSLKEKFVASTALRNKIGRPLKVDVKLTEGEAAVKQVAANWKSYVEIHRSRYSPSFLTRVWYFFTDTQYANSLSKLLRFDFGRSMVKPYDPVGPRILDAALVSAPIMLTSEILVYAIAVPLGLYLAVRRRRWQDRVGSLALFVLYSVPPVVLGMVFLTFLAFGKPFLNIFPMYGLHSENAATFSFPGRALDYAWHLVGPLLCLSITGIVSLAMFGRSSMLDVINQDYIRTAQAKGLEGRTVILRHALRNALIPTVTLFSSFIPAMLGGSVIIEVLFGIPGMGRLSYESIQAKDYNTVMALIYIDALVVMFSILLSDLLLVLVDPRITFGSTDGGA